MGKVVLKRRDIKVQIVEINGRREIDIAPPNQKVRSVINVAMVKSGITDGKAFMSGLVATALKAVDIHGEPDSEIKRLIAKSVAETLNETAAQ